MINQSYKSSLFLEIILIISFIGIIITGNPLFLLGIIFVLIMNQCL